MKYTKLGYSVGRKVLANLDKCSKNSASKVVNSPWGVFHMYKSSNRGRFYSVSDSKVLHNGGSYRLSTIRNKFGMLGLI